ncbi:hypothetical protein AAW14_24995 [Streptomyces hygroscopicus]|uniref:D-arabinono-1,4-lactone oxidase n=1 Tax=Streptomyces hygroscopicus TaxID=1912 RepID=UPI00223FD2C5|nr:D-arabinono-1,4-lactone oxidase [Streptomyces hygroscopicus]MCW7945175.1 hypothetical protein [Streptomyces hygroscopicus]
MTRPLTNWAGNIRYCAHAFEQPTSITELQGLVATSGHARVLGSGHSFNRIADTAGTLVSLDRMPRELEIDSPRMRVRVSANWLLGDLCERLHRRGLALHNLPSLPHISVAGACATATHGSGTSHASLAGAVQALALVTADGTRMELAAGDEDFDGAVVSLGALGVMTYLDLAVRPAYDIEQYVYEELPWTDLIASAGEILSSAYSVSIFTNWTDCAQIWVKRRTDDELPDLAWLNAVKADGPRHPVAGMCAANCTDQLGRPGPWHERLPHFRAGTEPATGNELQTEYFVPADLTTKALHQLKELRPLLAPVLQTSEIRTVAADTAWLSPTHGRNSTAIHFTWRPEEEAVRAVLPHVEDVLAPLAARPHWAKIFMASPRKIRTLYDHWWDFSRLRHTYDPRGKFHNPFTTALFTASDDDR